MIVACPVRKLCSIVIRSILTPLLTLASGAIIWTLFDLPINLSVRYAVFPCLIAFLAGVIFFSLGCRFSGLYVLGHELTHWLAAKLFLRRTGPLSVGLRGGCVPVERPNLFIVLSPYMFPLFSLIWIGLYGFLLIFRPHPGLPLICVFYGGVGLTYAYHVVMTSVALWRVQQDLKLYGPTFSLAVIVFGNAAVLFTALVIAGRHWETALPALLNNCRLLWGYFARVFRSI